MVQNDYGIKVKAITVRNPQANAIVERIHQVIDNMIRTFELEDKDVDQDVWKGIIAATSFAVRSTWHSTLQATPGQLVFGRDMVFAQSFAANWNLIRQRRQRMINYNNRRENSKRIDHTYRRGDKVLIKRHDATKLERPNDGPYRVHRAWNNGTVTLRIPMRGGASYERINIRRIKPYRE